MENKKIVSKRLFLVIMMIILMLQVIAAFYFCTQKQGFHYDEYYSYYSSNVTYGLVPTDEEWKDCSEIISEFMVRQGEGFSYKMVSLMQSYDVHPPLYYFVLHTVCSLTPGIFSKWQGLSVNLLFFVLAWLVLAKIAEILSEGSQKLILAVMVLFGFSPAVLSGITFIRMYMMLTFFCLLFLLIHLLAAKRNKRTVLSFYIPIIIVTFLGSMTHYYFFVFIFFTAVYYFFYLAFHQETRKIAPCYAASIIGGMLLMVMAYPACLSHIFRGYRGTEAKAAFFDFSNLGQRLSFFLGLINDYVFGGSFYLLILVLFLMYLTIRYLRTKKKISVSVMSVEGKKRFLFLVFLVVGYFLVVAKTALLNAEEAIRYEMPIYGLIILLTVFSVQSLLFSAGQDKLKKRFNLIFLILIVGTLVTELYGLTRSKVLFLYQEDKTSYEWAAKHQDDAIVYLYSPQNTWMIWDEAEELMQYHSIYFISTEHDSLKKDETLKQAPVVYVYAMRGEQIEKILTQLQKEYPQLTTCSQVRELLYCDLYELK